MIILLPLLAAILGLFVYLFAVNPKIAELGRIAYFSGLFVFLLRYGAQSFTLFK
jgi:hypothetical protein